MTPMRYYLYGPKGILTEEMLKHLNASSLETHGSMSLSHIL